ncbi:hypothetical protein D3C72_1158630 [compost metagenome]
MRRYRQYALPQQGIRERRLARAEGPEQRDREPTAAQLASARGQRTHPRLEGGVRRKRLGRAFQQRGRFIQPPPDRHGGWRRRSCRLHRCGSGRLLRRLHLRRRSGFPHLRQ